MTWQATYARRHRAVGIERPPVPRKPMTDEEFEAVMVELDKTSPAAARLSRACRGINQVASALGAAMLAPRT